MAQAINEFVYLVGGVGGFWFAMFGTIIACSILLPLTLGLGRVLGIFAIVRERQCNVYMLFGKVIGIIDEPGLHFLRFFVIAFGLDGHELARERGDAFFYFSGDNREGAVGTDGEGAGIEQII